MSTLNLEKLAAIKKEEIKNPERYLGEKKMTKEVLEAALSDALKKIHITSKKCFFWGLYALNGENSSYFGLFRSRIGILFLKEIWYNYTVSSDIVFAYAKKRSLNHATITKRLLRGAVGF